MRMESPVRICLGAALVVNLLLLGTTVNGNVLPETTPVTVNNRTTPHDKVNATWDSNKPNTPDISLNELNPKESVSEEHTEKNAKYKDRGRVRYFSQFKSSTESSLRRVKTPTDAAKLIIVTPTLEAKKPVEIIDSMRTYKKTKMSGSSSSTTPTSIEKEEQSIEEYDNEDDEEEKESFQKFTSSKFHENFFTIPSFDDDKDSFSNKIKQDYSSPSYGFSNFFPKDTSFSYGESSNNNNFHSASFFDFDSDLTTPKNDFFDKKFQAISGSIRKNLESIKAKSPPPNITNVQKIVKENVGLERLTNNTPSNKSTVFIKNTKEIRLSDNEGAAGSANKALSDVHGTSIYYEMSVLSTETYAINHSNDYDCDNETLPADPTVSTSSEEELASVKATKPTLIQNSTKPPYPDPTVDNITNVLPSSSEIPLSSSTVSISSTEQNIISPAQGTSTASSINFRRNTNYSKRFNLGAIKDSPNSVTIKPIISSYAPTTRKFYHTTPRNRPIWMAPKRNLTKLYFTRTPPTTIYSEHFNIRDKIANTFRPKLQSKATLTTVSSEIDPVLESEISGTKKIVHTQLLSDNTIPSLWKRGSTKYTTSTATSVEVSNVNEMEIPPTSIAWALATLKNPSPIPSSVNISSSTQKSIDENELQKVGEVLDKVIESTLTSTTETNSILVSENVQRPIAEVDQNKIQWQPTSTHISSTGTAEGVINADTKAEKLAAESNVSVQSISESQTTTTMKNKSKIFKPAWLPTTAESQQITEAEKNPSVDTSRSTGFESITKLPSDVTTPSDEIIVSSETNDTITEETPTINYEITTIRFSYVPTEPLDFTEAYDDDTESSTETNWRPNIPTRTKFTKTEDIPITTYRPKYITTTEMIEESTITLDTTPPVNEVSSQIVENATDKISETTHTVELTTVTEPTTLVTTKAPTTEATADTEMTTETTTKESTYPTNVEVTTPLMTITTFETTTTVVSTTPIPTTTVTATTPEETTTIVVEVVTEINTERERRITTTENSVTPSERNNDVTTDCSSEENDNNNEIINQDIISSSSSTSTTTMTPSTEKVLSTTERPKVSSTTEKQSATVDKVKDTTYIATTERVITTEVTKRTIIPEIKPETTPKSTTELTEEDKQTTHGEEDVSLTPDDCSTETDVMTKAVNNLEDLTDYPGEMTTEASSRVLSEESGSGAAVAIAFSTIGVIALVLLIGLLLVVRRRGRRGIYAQRCTPVSLDAYSLDSVSVGHRKGNHRLRASKRSYGNPAYDDEVTSHPMQYPALANFALDVESMTAEFAEIPSVTVRPEEVPPGCEDKNRYSNVLPLPETRVPLTRLDNDPTTEYINANYITGPGNIRNYYIACQAPLCNTVVDFWRMIWEQNSRLIVMLTEYMENGVEKCYEYLPPSEVSDNRRMFGDFKVILKKREQRDKYAISSIKLINLSSRTWREVTHLWYFWPAKGVPDDYDSIIDFLSEMRSYMKISQTAKEYDDEGVEVIYGDQNRSSYGNLAKLRSEEQSSGNGVNVYSPAKAEEVMRRHTNNGTLGRMKAASEIEGVRPCVVTCSSGAGRSAVLIALDISARALAAGSADVPRAVRHLRAQRPHSLSNRHHYILLYKVLSEYGNKLMGGGVDTI